MRTCCHLWGKILIFVANNDFRFIPALSTPVSFHYSTLQILFLCYTQLFFFFLKVDLPIVLIESEGHHCPISVPIVVSALLGVGWGGVGVEPRALCMLGKHSTTKLYLQILQCAY